MDDKQAQLQRDLFLKQMKQIGENTLEAAKIFKESAEGMTEALEALKDVKALRRIAEAMESLDERWERHEQFMEWFLEQYAEDEGDIARVDFVNLWHAVGRIFGKTQNSS